MQSIQRIFHPVGQGAFYTERHGNFNFVYDCGALPKRKSAEKIVKNAFLEKEHIDLLVLSHFDADHINLVETLKANCKIDTVWLPLMKPENITCIKDVYNGLQLDVNTQVFETPEQFFEGATIVQVSEYNPETPKPGDINYGNLRKDIESGSKVGIKSGSGKQDWCYIPFNIKREERSKQFEVELKKYSLSINEIKNQGLTYVIANKKNIKKAYDAVEGKINANSLMVFSVPLNGMVDRFYQRSHNRCCTYCIFGGYVKCLAGCLYTGDSGKDGFEAVQRNYNNELLKVGTIQIPHHGSVISFHNGLVKERNKVCIISHGLRNNFGHPSGQVISEIISHGNCPIQVTENLDSLYVECFC